MKITDIVEGYTVLPNIDKEKYQARDGLEGPFRLRNGKVVYYDPQEGKYYDPDTDMYIEYDDYRKMDEQGVAEAKGLKKRVKVVKGPHTGKTGWIREVKHGAHKTAPKSYNVDLDDGSHADNLPGTALRLVKEEQTVAEGDKRPKYVVTTKDKPKKVKPSMGGESPHPYQGKLVGATEAEVSNTDYDFTHGKKPKGQGSWFFVAHRGGVEFGKDVEGEDYIQLNQMSYGDAKKAAVKWAKSKGHTSLFVAT